jgi:hypothetical protein
MSGLDDGRQKASDMPAMMRQLGSSSVTLPDPCRASG